MSLKVYNTLTKKKEIFTPINEGKVNMYVCGVTPYNHPHIGNARPFVTWDTIRRYLEFIGYDVLHVQNFTDVDDKIINKAMEEKSSWDQISGRYIDAYFTAIDKLNVKRAHMYPRVSTHMEDIIKMISGIMAKGYAYAINGDVYFRVEKFAGYGKLSGRNLEDIQSGAGARVDVDMSKEHPMDFALWKSAKPGEPSWESPWGAGRPGWHIECSAMSTKYFGASFDLHGGGSDLIFPHHENEIAQSEACTGCEPFVKYWLHNGFITVNEEKMSKSLGNFFLVTDILEHFDAETVRFFILSTHYRSPLDFSDERLSEAKRSLERLIVAKENLLALAKLAGANFAIDETAETKVNIIWQNFLAAMDDDFNTALAISEMFALAKEINIYYKKVSEQQELPNGKFIDCLQKIFAQMTSIIGVLEKSAVVEETAATMEAELMDILIALRTEAKSNKNYALADAIRNKLTEINVVLTDTPQGVRWQKK